MSTVRGENLQSLSTPSGNSSIIYTPVEAPEATYKTLTATEPATYTKSITLTAANFPTLPSGVSATYAVTAAVSGISWGATDNATIYCKYYVGDTNISTASTTLQSWEYYTFNLPNIIHASYPIVPGTVINFKVWGNILFRYYYVGLIVYPKYIVLDECPYALMSFDFDASQFVFTGKTSPTYNGTTSVPYLGVNTSLDGSTECASTATTGITHKYATTRGSYISVIPYNFRYSYSTDSASKTWYNYTPFYARFNLLNSIKVTPLKGIGGIV